jgi:hypothetical protein
MNNHPILFSGDMVRAILEGRKTQTRRVIRIRLTKEQKTNGYSEVPFDILPMNDNAVSHQWITLQRKEPNNKGLVIKYPMDPGDHLWVRETWRITGWNESGDWCIEYKDGTHKWFDDVEEVDEETTTRYWIDCTNDCEKANIPEDPNTGNYIFDDQHPVPTRWRPSIFLPRWASRITLEILKIRVERIQDITPEDCEAEGVGYRLNDLGWRYAFGSLWNSINEKRGFGWDVNPFVWVIEFRRLP